MNRPCRDEASSEVCAITRIQACIKALLPRCLPHEGHGRWVPSGQTDSGHLHPP